MSLKVYLTEYYDANKNLKCERLQANSWEEADKIAKIRGVGETVIGQFMGEVEWK